MELAESYLFCPACGTKRTSFVPLRPFRCTACSHTSFFGPVAAVGAVVTNSDGKILLIRRAKDPGKGKLGMPGGFVDPSESVEAALIREVQVEVGLKIRNLVYLMSAPNSYVYDGIVVPVVDMFFHAGVGSSENIAADDGEVADWIWTELNHEIINEMAFASNRQALEYYRNLRGAVK